MRRLVTATITYNVVEAIVAITAGLGASSVALVGFGLDSTLVIAAVAVRERLAAWRGDACCATPACTSTTCVIPATCGRLAAA